MATQEERLTAVEDTNSHTKELTEKVAQLVLAHESDLEVTKREARQFRRWMVLIAKKMNWLDDEDLKEFESED